MELLAYLTEEKQSMSTTVTTPEVQSSTAGPGASGLRAFRAKFTTERGTRTCCLHSKTATGAMIEAVRIVYDLHGIDFDDVDLEELGPAGIPLFDKLS